MSDIALYFPFAKLPDDAWIKAAALCWPQLGRISPRGFFDARDSDTVKRLRDELDFVVNVYPGMLSFDDDRLVDNAILSRFRPPSGDDTILGNGRRITPPGSTDDHVMALFQDFLLRYSEELVPRYGIQALGIDSIDGRGAAYRDPRLVRLDLGKFPNAIARQLDHLGLQLYDGYHVMMHPRLAAVYLAVLADVLARENGMTPVTDQPVHCAAAHGWTIDALAEILLTDEHHARVRSHEDYTHAFAVLSVQTVLPRDLATIPVGRVIEARRRLLPELIRYREFLDSLVPELVEISAITDSVVREKKLHNRVESQIKQPIERMEREIGSLGMQPVRAVLSMNSLAPPAALAVLAETVELPSVIAGSGMVAGCLIGATYNAMDQRRQVLAAEPTGYLLNLRSEFKPSDTVSRIRSAVRRALPRG
ncbi:DUF6236 family protein [Nocardia testacea]|uniref:DUF6236 family protein n=1 Tax=Nocardia testacea TaxID=248551 RepID=A0ABW7VQH0_9NOCA